MTSKTTAKRTAMSPLERRAELAKIVRLRNTTLLAVVRDVFMTSYSHYRLVISGDRAPSQALADRICAFVGHPPHVFFGRKQFNAPPRKPSR